jgi:hypothetical protein
VLLIVLLVAGAAAPAPPPTTPAPAATRAQVLLLEFTSSDVPRDKLALLEGSMASALAKRPDIQAITLADLKAMTDIEATKAASGCDESSCLAELASALGARYVIYGRLGALGEELILQINLFDAAAAQAVAREERRARSLGELSVNIPSTMDALLLPIGPAPAVADAGMSSMHVAGAAIAIGGGVLAFGAGAGAAYFENTLWSDGGALAEKETAYTAAPWFWGATIAGVAVAALGGALLLVPSGDDAPADAAAGGGAR